MRRAMVWYAGAVAVVAAGTLVIGGCTTDTPTRVQAPRFDVRNGTDVQGAPISALTRAVALALQDDGLRHRIKNDLQASRFTREHKLEFGEYLHGNGGILLTKMAKETGQSADSLLSLLHAIGKPLEFYMPVAAHRESWTGDADLIVAASIKADYDTPVAFALDGSPVTLSAHAPPATPTLVLVPVETDFSNPLPSRFQNGSDRHGESIGTYSMSGNKKAPAINPMIHPTRLPDPCDTDPSSCPGDGGDGGMPPEPPGIYMDQMMIRDTHEPWIRGAPEIDVVFWGYVHGDYVFAGTTLDGTPYFTFNPNALKRIYAGCAGERAADWRNFNFDATGLQVPVWNTALLAETDEFTVVESISDPNYGNIVRYQRRVPLQPPFEFEVLERDDGSQCPAPPRYYNLDGTLRWNFQRHRPMQSNLGFPDFAALFGANNDRIALFGFSSTQALEAVHGTVYYGQDADIWLSSRGFQSADVVVAQDPYYP